MKKLIKSYKFWTALAGAVGLIVTAISDVIGINISADGVKESIMGFCGMLVAVGVVKMPEHKSNTAEKTAQNEKLKKDNEASE